MNPAGVVLLAAIAGLAVQSVRLCRRWAVGRPQRVDWYRGLLGLARAYLHVVHDVVARENRVARMHARLAGGFLAALVLSLPLHILGLGGAPLALLILLSLGVAGAGLVLEIGRRGAGRPVRLSGGAYEVLPLALAATVGFLGLSALLVLTNGPGWLWGPAASLGVVGLGWLVHSTFAGPMRHALAGATHLVVHPRPPRLSGARDTALRPLDLSPQSEEPLGAGRMADFAWNRLVSFDSCVQCGKCEAVCPAFAAGQPLNPKALINDLVRATGPGVAVPYAGSPHPGRPAGVNSGDGHMPLLAENLVDGFIAPDTLWACTTCRACVYECPMLIEHVDAVIDLRRHLTLERGEVPERVAAVLGELRAADTPSGRALEDRLNWAVDLKLPLIAERGEADVLLWIGEAGYERRNQKTLRALVRLLRAANVDFAVLGAEELDCGDTARRLGDELTFQRLARANIETLSRYRFNTIVTADPHVLQAIGTEFHDFGTPFHIQHHTTYLDRLLTAGRLHLTDFSDESRTVTFHDPCYLGRYNGEIAAPRALLDRLGLERVEMEKSGFKSSCCGGGGGAALADVPGKRRIPDQRMDHARSTGAGIVAVACPNCMTMLEGVTGPRPEVLDIAELLVDRLAASA